MGLKTYVWIWIFILVALSLEFVALTYFPAYSVLKHFDPTFTPDPGRKLSLYLGWIGIIVMLMMNVYILRKRFGMFKSFGSVPAWLEFHIFCGLVGPTFILFHCDFKVRGLVAISFWSMIVSASSGVVGRYFYLQILEKRKEIEDDVDHWKGMLKGLQAKANPPPDDALMDRVMQGALRFVGVGASAIGADGAIQVSALSVFFASLIGDIRLLFDLPKTAKGLPPFSRVLLRNYALSERRILFLEPFRNLMGYWHTFHTPFAIFMYAAAIIHIAVALLLGVTK